MRHLMLVGRPLSVRRSTTGSGNNPSSLQRSIVARLAPTIWQTWRSFNSLSVLDIAKLQVGSVATSPGLPREVLKLALGAELVEIIRPNLHHLASFLEVFGTVIGCADLVLGAVSKLTFDSVRVEIHLVEAR